MITDTQARSSLKKLIIKYSPHGNLETKILLDLVDDTSRQIPIRGALENIKGQKSACYTQQEIDLINELLYLYS